MVIRYALLSVTVAVLYVLPVLKMINADGSMP